MAGFKVGIRQGIRLKQGQASKHRESDVKGKAVCGKLLAAGSIRQAVDTDYYRRCPQCFKGTEREVWQLFHP